MDYRIVLPVLISFALSVIMGPVVIPILRKLKLQQTEREDGVESHLKKGETPTMGGVTLGFGLIGFLDDYLKVVMKRSDGLYPKQKMALQILVTGVFAFYLVRYTEVSLTWMIPFTDGKYLNLGILTIPMMFVVIIGTVNGVNFTDGLDGLASSVTVLVATFFTVVAIGTKSGIEPITCAANVP